MTDETIEEHDKNCDFCKGWKANSDRMIFTKEEWEYFCNKINWSNSFLDARAVRIMNKPFNKEDDCDG